MPAHLHDTVALHEVVTQDAPVDGLVHATLLGVDGKPVVSALQDTRELLEDLGGLKGILAVRTDVVREPKPAESTPLKVLVEGVQVEVGEYGTDGAALEKPLAGDLNLALSLDGSRDELPYELQARLVTSQRAQKLEEPAVGNGGEVVLEVDLAHIGTTLLNAGPGEHSCVKGALTLLIGKAAGKEGWLDRGL